MWLINVVVIITFLFFILNVFKRAIKQKSAYLYILLGFAIGLEVIFVWSMLNNVNLMQIFQVLVLIFAYLIPMGITLLNSANVSIRLKILYAVAKLAYAFKKYEFAQGLMREAIKKDKTNVNFYYLRSKALEQMNDLPGARDMMFKVVELDRENTPMYLELAQILDKENKKDTALVMLAHALKIDPNFALAKEMMGIIYSEIGRIKEAVTMYEELAVSGEGTYNTYYNLAIIYWRNNEIDKAIKAYNVAVGMNPKLYEAHYALGRLYYMESNYEQSIYNLEIALKDKSLKAKAEYMLAQNYMKQEEYEKAVEYLESAISQDKTLIEKVKSNEVFDKISLELATIEDKNKEIKTAEYVKEG